MYRFSTIGAKNTAMQSNISFNYFSTDFLTSVEEHQVIKLSNEKYLIYIKPPTSFYSADHSPIICWKGSGYKVIKEEIINTKSNKVYYNELKKDNDILYSTWWYDSGNDKTISQYKWRFKNLISGDDYYLVNVISDNKNDVILKTDQLLIDTIFNDAE